MNRTFKTFFILCIGIGLIYLGSYINESSHIQKQKPSVEVFTPAIHAEQTSSFSSDEQNNISVFRKTNRSVVYVTNSQIQQNFFSLNVQEIPQGTGTGFIWDNTGLIVTNFHVIRSADKVTIKLADNTSWVAQLVGIAPDKDLAVLKIDAPTDKLVPIKIGNSRDLEVGRKVLAIGNPFGLDATLTVGVVSALGREIDAITGRKIKGAIQTDAAINPGNSGGPLLNSKGELIGVNTAIYSPSGGSSGIGFAIPVDTVKKIIPQLIQYGRVMRPIIGIHLLDDSIARNFGIEGVIVGQVVQGGPAYRAGLKGVKRNVRGSFVLGDVITELDNQSISTNDDLLSVLETHKPGDVVTLESLRQGKKKSFQIRLARSEN
ncbi:MAG: trypsin-like serine protease [Proteobacteria bacterium]|nr:trypsin-like serine protease [Pseudomonadota bacterium]